MIVPTFPLVEDQHDREEIRKALLNMALQINIELDRIRERLDKLEGV